MDYMDKLTVDGAEFSFKDVGAARFDDTQNLTAAQKAAARNNIGATGIDDLVNVDNTLTQSGEAADAAVVGVALNGKIDGAYVDDEGYLVLTINGEPAGERLGPFIGGGGGGGGGSGNNAVMTISKTTDWTTKTIAQGSTCLVSFTWSSLEDELPTGNGNLRVTVGSSIKKSMDIEQGSIEIDVAPFLANGTNTVSLTVTDIYGNTRNIRVTVNLVALSLTSSFNPEEPYTGAINFPYVPVGNVTKTVKFFLDGSRIGTATVTTSGRQQTFIIPTQSHGAHTFSCYFEAEIDGETVQSNTLNYEIICIVSGNETPIITSPFNESSVSQYSSVDIGYIVYSPASLTTPITIKVNGDTAATLTVDRTPQMFSARAMETGTMTVQITTGTQGESDYASRTFTLTVTETQIHVEAETENLALHLTAYGRSNTEADKESWTSGSIAATLTGFNWTSDGWQRDENNATALRVSGDARVAVPYKIFETDFRSTGKTIEVEFATRNVMNYDSVIMSCLSEGRGLSITAQKAQLISEQSVIGMQFKENEHVRISFVVEKRSEQRLIYCYVNGIVSGVVRYPEDDDFSQTTPVNISIGSNDCTMDVYCIRVYDNDLTRQQMLENWIADSPVMSDLVDRYTRNNVYDAYGAITIAKLPSDLPYMVLQCPELPQYKGDKKTLDGYYVDPINPGKSFSFTGAQFDVQGTSSQYYERKNYKGKFKKGFVLPNGTTVSKYQHVAGDIPVNVFCFKADVASSEGANNVELVRAYDNACPYKTPGQEANSAVRQGIDGFPIVIFWDNGDEVMFMGKYNFNTDKSAEEFFGFQEDDESWETLNHGSDRILFKSNDFSSMGVDKDGNPIPAWLNDFEARFPDTDPPFQNPAQLKDFADWIVTTDQAAATGDTLEEPVTYETGEYDQQGNPITVTYTTDSAAYRLAKFRAELGNYVEMDSCLFFYLFTELFLMVDNRAKNMFISFMGSTINSGGETE